MNLTHRLKHINIGWIFVVRVGGWDRADAFWMFTSSPVHFHTYNGTAVDFKTLRLQHCMSQGFLGSAAQQRHTVSHNINSLLYRCKHDR